jgi:glycosyltransferase involved in cell wall biosynthesis
MGLAEAIRWPGDLCRNRYLDSLAGADIYVSTSPTDSTSVSLLEAMAAGLAVVVPDIAGNREWVKSEESGLLYPAGDARALSSAVMALLQDRGRAAALGRRARAEVEMRGLWSSTIRRAELLFDQLTNA